MSDSRWLPLPVLLLGGLLAPAAGCGPADPVQQVLEERARWEAEIVGWTQAEDTVQTSIRVAGPVSAKLRTLTVRIDLVDASGVTIEQVWEPLDVSQAVRGASAEVFVSIPTRSEVDGLAVVVVTDPTPEESKKIVELTGVRSCNLTFSERSGGAELQRCAPRSRTPSSFLKC